jgi:HD superfamily phosphohydrolase
MKHTHELRDPIHGFIRLSSDERKVLDSRPFQRLRYIHQLAMTYLVYPGATHRRFEYSLGVMELAGRVFDIVTKEENIHHEAVRRILPDRTARDYWRVTLRMAALCHDVGHLPFSHAAEDLLPAGHTHESITVALIKSDEMQEIWRKMRPMLDATDIARLAVGKKELPDELFTDWEALLAEIIIGASFGVDRMDYLLRDSYHAGVAYGRFDVDRLVDSLRMLPDSAGTPYSRVVLGVDEGGLHAAEALLLARYFMFMQVYLHPVRRIYDIHLQEFLKATLAEGHYSVDLEEHLRTTDDEILSALRRAAWQSGAPGHEPAARIIGRNHFRRLYKRTLGDPVTAARSVEAGARDRFGGDAVRYDYLTQRSYPYDFPVRLPDDRTVPALTLSEPLRNSPLAGTECVFIAPEYADLALQWYEAERERIFALVPSIEEEH